MLLTKLEDNLSREWYASKSLEHGWSSNVLWHMIDMRLIEREGQAVTNFPETIPPQDSDMAIQIFKDPYIFDFLGTDGNRRELEIERSLIDHMEKFLLELGHGFAFVGRQVHLEFSDSDYYIDLLFYHLKLRCYVVVELKARKFEVGDLAQLNMYINVVNDLLCHPDDKPTIGLLLVKEKNRNIVEFALEGYKNPISVSDWQDEFDKTISLLKSNLPTVDELEREMEYLDSLTIEGGTE